MFNLKIETGNAYFAGREASAVADQLHGIANRLRSGITKGSVFDVNGNRVGTYELVPDEG